MSFNRRDIRPGMDVYTLDNHYLGTVLEVIAGPAQAAPEQVAASSLQSSLVSGETLGPAPTQSLGNSGPTAQSAAARYATRAGTPAALGSGAFKVGTWWGLRERRTIPLEEVQTVSLERVVLRWKV
ncbi:MAG: hypothetical protein H0T73_08955 [Ardenticatenales bacterium]|nr:hypothetical protein [Ardenticatenales bacterium]